MTQHNSQENRLLLQTQISQISVDLACKLREAF